MSTTAVEKRPMVMTARLARRNLEQAIERIGGLTFAAARTGVSEQNMRNWLKRGNLNQADALNAARFARAAKRPLADFLDESDG